MKKFAAEVKTWAITWPPLTLYQLTLQYNSAFCLLFLVYSNFHFASLDLLTIEAHVFTPEPVKYEKKDGQWYTHDGVDVIETQTRKGTESVDLFNSFKHLMVTLFFILDMALISAGCMYHTLLIVGGRLCSKVVYSDPIMYYMFLFTLWAWKRGVSIARQKCCACNFLYWPVGLLCLIEMVTLPSSLRPSSTASSIDIETNTDYLKTAKKGGGHKG